MLQVCLLLELKLIPVELPKYCDRCTWRPEAQHRDNRKCVAVPRCKLQAGPLLNTAAVREYERCPHWPQCVIDLEQYPGVSSNTMKTHITKCSAKEDTFADRTFCLQCHLSSSYL